MARSGSASASIHPEADRIAVDGKEVGAQGAQRAPKVEESLTQADARLRVGHALPDLARQADARDRPSSGQAEIGQDRARLAGARKGVRAVRGLRSHGADQVDLQADPVRLLRAPYRFEKPYRRS